MRMSMSKLPHGIYEQLLDEELHDVLHSHPDLKSILRSIDDEDSPHIYAQFLSRLIHQALRGSSQHHQIDLVNRLVSAFIK